MMEIYLALISEGGSTSNLSSSLKISSYEDFSVGIDFPKNYSAPSVGIGSSASTFDSYIFSKGSDFF